jgi:TonB family protein
MLSEVVNHLWQSTLFAVALAALAAVFRNDGAHVRYWLWWTASVKFLVPFSLLTLLGSTLGASLWRHGAAPVDLVEWRQTLGFLEPLRTPRIWTAPALAALAVWACGTAAVAAVWVTRALKVRSLLREATPCPAPVPPGAAGLEVRVTASLLEPVLVGIVQPVLLLPSGIERRLTRAQLDAVVAHEVAHWRRRDNLTAAVHLLVEAVFWFHPLVWWLGARLVKERERACDEAVVRAGHDGRTYAEGILSVCEHYVASTLKCTAGVTGADLKRRVIEIARSRVMSELRLSKRIALGAFALVAVSVPVVFGMAQGDRDLIPIVRIAPVYPPALLAAQVEGEVNLRFTVTATGTVKDIAVVHSTAPEFEEPAITALSRWRYQPPAEGERPGVLTMIRFQLNAPGAAPN